MTKILVIAKDRAVCDILRKELAVEGLWAHAVRTEEEVAEAIEAAHYELIIRDSSYKGTVPETGAPLLSLCELMEHASWEQGHCLFKPLRRQEFKEKIHELLNDGRERLIIYKDLKIDLKKHLVVVKDKMVRLGRMEKDLLVLMVKKAGQIVHAPDESLRPHLSELKRKLKASAGEAIKITTYYGGGYMLEYHAT